MPADRSATERLARSRGGSGTAPPLLEAPLGSFATRVPVSCAPTTPIREVLETLAREAVGAMVVVDDERRPVGVFTLRDVLERVALPGVEPTAPVASVMASNVFSLPSHALGFEAAVMMRARGSATSWSSKTVASRGSSRSRACSRCGAAGSATRVP